MLRSLIVVVLAIGLPAVAAGQKAEPRDYAFKQPPLAIYDAVVALKIADAPAMSAQERKLLETVWQWRREKKSTADARPD
ncbi:MAG TPA: hypothetical protein VJ809_01565, partial [Pirellulales bacterium]|nr:hypothetical protein [Pirellulales bacterium]